MDSLNKTVSQLVRGDQIDDFLLLVDSANFKQTKDKKPFMQLILRDQSGSIHAIRWEAEPELFHAIKVGNVVKINGRVQEYKGNLQLLIDKICKVNDKEIPWHTFLPKGNTNNEKLWAELNQIVSEVKRPEIKELLLSFLEDPGIASRLKTWPAGKTLHHAYLGGLLEHIVSIIKSAHSLNSHWPGLDSDLLTAGAILHDIGKIEEISCDGSIQYTDRGQLIGHTQLGILLLHDKARGLPDFPPDLLVQIEHIIASHQGKLEFGAARPPLSGEAITIHFLDNLDSKLSAYFSLINQEEESPYGKNWTSYHKLFDSRLYKPNRLGATPK